MATANKPKFLSLMPALVLAFAVSMPMLLVFAGWLDPQQQTLEHIVENLLARLVTNTLMLLVGVSIGVLLLGVSLAWITREYQFFGASVYRWALMLPLAIPGYVMAFVILGIFDFTGPLQTILTQFDAKAMVPEIRHPLMVIVTLTLVLFPYVFMLASAAFAVQSNQMQEAAQSLGLSKRATFYKITLPMARPAIIAGLSLALMETLADFGTVSIFNFDTFTTAIYKAWFGMFNISAAAQLASILLLIVAIALVLEQQLRGRAKFTLEDLGSTPKAPKKLSGGKAWLYSGYCFVVLLLAFILPVTQLIIWTIYDAGEINQRFIDLALKTLMLGLGAGIIVTLMALLLASTKRRANTKLTNGLITTANLGYAMPGSVLAVGVMLTLTFVDKGLNQLLGTEGQLLAGGVIGLLFAYSVRFMAAGFGPIDSAFTRIKPSITEAAQNLGASNGQITRRIYWPLLRPGLFAGLLLVMVDVMKEMPATLLLRPFGWDTLAVRIYELTSEGEWQLAALPALTLVLIGLLPVYFLVSKSSVNASK